MIKIICVGKIKEQYLKNAIEDYRTRITKYTKINIFEVSDVDGDSINIILEKEMSQIQKYIESKDYIISLDIDGEMLSSIDFSKKIDTIFNTNSNITFIIGGSYGLHQKIKEISNYRLSFSKMTFPHQLFRVMLLEQIYRVFKINNNETYHK